MLLMMLIGTTRSYAQNTWNPGTEGDWTYVYRAGVAKLASYEGTEETITTPTTLGGNPVTIISASFNTPNTTLKNLTISEGVVQIEGGPILAFCSLTSVSLPTSLVSIGRYVFQDCSSLTSIVLPAGIKTINRGVFSHCTSLASVTMLGAVGSIGSDAFADCQALKSITIPASVTFIEKEAFYHSGLEHLWYNGTKAQWDNVIVETNAFGSSSNTTVFTPTIHWCCTATFDMQGHGTAPAAQTVYSAVANALTVPTAPTAQGYDFGGWYADADCTQAFDFTAALDDNVTVYAKWTKKMNTITLDYDGRSLGIRTAEIWTGETVPIPLVQFDDTDGIEGWYTDAGRTTPYDFTTVVDHDFTLYAKWAPAGTATITTNAGGTATLTNANGQKFNNGLVMPGIYTLTVTPNDGYSFNGYYKLTNRSSHIFTDNDIVGSATKTYTLDLTEKDAVISVTFSSNPILTVTKRADDERVLNKVTWSIVNNQDANISYVNGSTIPYISDPNGAVVSNFGIRLNVDLGSLIGYAFTATITDRGNGTTTQYNSQQGTSFLIQPYGSIDIDLYVYPMTDILLLDDADNSYTLAKYMGIATYYTTLQGRTLYKDGRWNTLCLPFDVSSFSGTPLEGATVMSLKTTKTNGSGFNAESGTLTLNFSTATSITAGKAYIVKWTKPADYEGNESSYDISNPTFTDVTISSTAPKASNSNDGKVSFVGCYSPLSISGNDRSILLLGSDNTPYNPRKAMNVNSCRAYFQLNGIEVGTEVSTYKLNFGGADISGTFESYGITTGIDDASHLIDNGQLTTDNVEWYNMNGQKMNRKPTKRGIYVNNGRKVVIK